MKIEQAVVGEYVKSFHGDSVYYDKIREIENNYLLFPSVIYDGFSRIHCSKVEYTGFKNKWQTMTDDEIALDLEKLEKKLAIIQKHFRIASNEFQKRGSHGK